MTGEGEEVHKYGHHKFIAGVVEGFYGRPWSADQRKLLFQWMQRSGLNTYMYAPKDDYKHRAYWRDLYSVEEAENLTYLINSAKEKGVTFVYAISPGLDISFANAKDVQALKRKLEQVSTFGCDAFAVLFDDIEPELSEMDRSAFQSFGSAQVSISNDIYEHLDQPKLFLFCPTEYCSSRAVPDVSSSEYLNTIGSKLLPGIDILWTGPRVVSKTLSIPSLEEISSVLKRPAVIWDNIHANDYDPRRIFLGPYDGRSPEIIPYINGVMTNPNTEFEANFMAIHTLGQWTSSNPDGVKKDLVSRERLSPIAADIKLETESDFSSDDEFHSPIDLRYQPKLALKAAINDWMSEIHTNREPPSQLFPRVIPKFGVPPGVPTDGLPVKPCLTPCLSPVPSEQVMAINGTNAPTSMPTGIPSCAPGNPPIPPGVSPFPPSSITSQLDIPSTAPPCLDPLELESTDNCMPASPPAGLPLPDIIKTCLTQTSTTVSITPSGMNTPISFLDTSHHLPDPLPTFLQPSSVPVNSLYEMPPSCSDLDSLSDSMSAGAEPMDIAGPSCSSDIADPVSGPSPPLATGLEEVCGDPLLLGKENSSDSLMQVESPEMMPSESKQGECENPLVNGEGACGRPESYFREEDCLLLVDMFYMPFEHGSQSLVILQKLHWLRTNSSFIAKSRGKDCNSFEVTEWHHQCEEFHEKVDAVIQLLDKLVLSPNKSFMCDMYSYLWDLVSILRICKAYVQWLALGLASYPQAQQTFGVVTWFTKSYRDAFLCGEQEPWIFRGGLQSELQRLLPVDSAHDLFYIKPPDYIVSKSYKLRPFHTPVDEDIVYQICLKTCDDGMDGTDVFPGLPQLMGDKLLGKFVTLSPEFGFVIEDELGVCGYALAALDSKELNKKSKIAWIPTMCEKYPLSDKDSCSPANEVMQGFHSEQEDVNEEVYSLYPSVLRLDILASRIEDPAIPRRLLACVLSALKSCGSKGVHCELNVGDKFMVDFYAKLGFSTFSSLGEPVGDYVYLGRCI